MIKQTVLIVLLLCSTFTYAQVTHTIAVTIDPPANCQTLGTTDEEFKGFSLYPNPARNQITIESISTESIEELTLFNPLGQEILQRSYSENIQKVILPTSRIKAGFYFIQVKTRARKYNYRILIKID